MLQVPGVEDSTVREVIWRSWEGPGLEYLRLAERADDIDADVLMVDLYEYGAFRLRYRIACDTEWRVRQVRLGPIDGKHKLDLSANGEGRWFDKDGLPIAELEGCVDVDVSGSPFTNTLPIRRLQLQPGQSADLPIAYIFVPTLQIERHMQRYTCLEAGPEGGLYRFEALNSGYTALLPVDTNGLVMDYPELSRRSWISEYRTVREGDRAT